jgi:hypothetical protein
MPNIKKIKNMKLIKNIALLAIVLVGISSCSLEDPIESQITEYAEFEVTDGPYVYWEQGEAFVEPGVVALAGGESLEVMVDGAVDVNTPGVYVLNYSAVNADGFPATTTRYVAVGKTDVAFNRDLSGLYLTGTRENTVTQIIPGFYLNSDTLPNNSVSVFMVDLGNGQLIIPAQQSRFGTVVADSTIIPGSGVTLDSETGFTIKQDISCCGLFTRIFIKQ